MITFTERARGVLGRADLAARRFNPDARVRIARAGDQIASSLADTPSEGDQVIEVDGVTVFVGADLTGEIDAGEHDRFVVR